MADKKSKVVMRKISEIREEFFARQALDEGYAMKLGLLVESGVEMNPIEITEDGVLADGRHRLAGYKLAMRVEIPCIVLPPMTRAELLAYAMGKNEGGSKPLTEADAVFAISQMIEVKASERSIYELIEKQCHYPKVVIRKLLDKSKRQVKARRLLVAKLKVIDEGMSVAEAAEIYGLNLAEFKVYLKGAKKKKTTTSVSMKREITVRMFRSQRGIQAVIKRLVEGFIDGSVDENVADDVFHHLDLKIKQTIRARDEWIKRYKAARSGQMINWKDALPGVDMEETKARAA